MNGLIWLVDALGGGWPEATQLPVLTGMGFLVEQVELWSETPPTLSGEAGLEAALAEVGVGEGMRAVSAARQKLREAGCSDICVLGLGTGGLMAVLAAGALPGFTAVVAFGPRLVHPVLTKGHPMQPVDLLAGARVPVQVHLAEHSVSSSARAQERLEAWMERAKEPHQLFRYPGLIDGFERQDSPSAAQAWYRARDFLGFHARLEQP